MASLRSRPTAPILYGLHGAEVVFSLWACAAGPALAQSGACVLSPDKHNPSEQILRCGSELTITPAPGTQYHPAPTGQDGLPPSVQLDSGALLIEFHSKRRHEFQILTPATIASVRGTKWAMEVKPGQTSTLVLEGHVTVRRKDTAERVVVGPGQGVDVSTGEAAAGKKRGAGPAPFAAKRWAPARVKALLARFGQ